EQNRVKNEVEALLKRQKELANPGDPAAKPGAQSAWKGSKLVSGFLGAFAGEKAAAHAKYYEQALAIERTGQVSDAVKLFKQASDAGSGPAAKRLGEIYAEGAGDVTRDFKKSAMWF